MNAVPALKINLLSRKKVVFDRQAALSLKVKLIAGVILVAYVALLIGVVSFVGVFRLRLNSTQAAVEKAKLSLASHALVITQYTGVTVSSKTIQTILNQRRETVQLWQQLQQMIPQGCDLTSFAINGDQLQIGVKAPHVLLANQMMDVMEQQFAQLGAKKTTVSITRGENAAYMMSMVLALKPASPDTKL